MARPPKPTEPAPESGNEGDADGTPVSIEQLLASQLGDAAVLPAEGQSKVPAEALAEAIDHRIIELLQLHDYLRHPRPGTLPDLGAHHRVLAGRKQLAAAIEQYDSRVFDIEENLERVLTTRTNRSAVSKALQERINHTLGQCGYDARTFWGKWYAEDGPKSQPASKDQAARRASKA
jgi:hypothetical protein